MNRRPTRLLAIFTGLIALAVSAVVQLSARAEQQQKRPPGAPPRPVQAKPASPAELSTLNLSEIKVFKAGIAQPKRSEPANEARPPIVVPLHSSELAAARKHIFGLPRDVVLDKSKITLNPLHGYVPNRAQLQFDHALSVVFQPNLSAQLMELYIRLTTQPNQIYMFDVMVWTPAPLGGGGFTNPCLYAVSGPEGQKQQIPCLADKSKEQHLLFGMQSGSQNVPSGQIIKIENQVYWHFHSVDITQQ